MEINSFEKKQALNDAMDKADGVCGFAALLQVLREAHVLSEGEVQRVVQLKDEYLQKYVELNEQLIKLLEESTEDTILDNVDPVLATLDKLVTLRLMSPQRVAEYKENLVKVREGKEALAKLPDEILKMDDPQPALDKVDEVASLGVLSARDVRALKKNLMGIWEGRDKQAPKEEADEPR